MYLPAPERSISFRRRKTGSIEQELSAKLLLGAAREDLCTFMHTDKLPSWAGRKDLYFSTWCPAPVSGSHFTSLHSPASPLETLLDSFACSVLFRLEDGSAIFFTCVQNFSCGS